MNELEKCPFCGDEIKVFQNMKKKWVPFCDHHECFRFDGFDTEEEAIAAVNKRRPTVSIEDLRGVVDHLERVRQIDMINGVDDGSSDVDTGRQYAIDKIKELLP